MKRIIIIVLLFFVGIQVVPAQKKKYVISGVIDNSDRPEMLRVKDGDLAFLWFDNPEKKIEVPVKDGRFRIEGHVDHPTRCFFGVGGPAQYIILDNANYWVTLTFYKGKGTLGDHVMCNEMRITSDSDLFNTFMSWYDMNGRYYSELKRYMDIARTCHPDSIDYYKKKIESVKREMDSVSLSTARKHPNKYLLPFVLLRQFDFSYKRLWKEYETIPNSVKLSPIGKEVRRRLLKTRK
jgi:hypothetical protein